jgi:two-component system response regulator YesN
MMLRVLIVDDDFNIREGLKLLIDWQAEGFVVVGAASDAIQALQMIDGSKPDIVITDIRMPEMDGLQFIQKVQESNRDIQFIILSAYSSFHYAKEAIRSEVVDYLVKPVEEKELIQVLKRAKNRVSKQQQTQQEIAVQLRKQRYIRIENQEKLSRHSTGAIRYIMDHYAEKISVNQLAGEMYINPAYLGQLFRKETGYSFCDFLNRYRIDCAINLLARGDLSVAEISQRTGYRYGEHFYRVFKAITGKNPKDFSRE